MSMHNIIHTSIEKHVGIFLQKVSQKYNLNIDDLTTDWNEYDGSKPKPKPTPKTKEPKTKTKESTSKEPTSKESTSKESTSSSDKDLSKCLKSELQEMCKEKGFKHTGTKPELIAALTGGGGDSDSVPPVLKKLIATIPTVSITRNKFGNHEHTATGLIFDKKTKKVTGKQNENGSVDILTAEDINLCNKYKFGYNLPSNLDKVNDVNVDDLDEELDDDDDVVESDDENLLEEELLEEEVEESEVEEEEEEEME